MLEILVILAWTGYTLSDKPIVDTRIDAHTQTNEATTIPEG